MKAITMFRMMAAAAMFSFASGSVQAGLHEDPQTLLGPASCNVQTYAAIGDSYSAGLYSQPYGELPICPNNTTGPNCTSTVCARNVGAYGYVFANTPPVVPNFQFLACSGANTSNCTATQVKVINPKADLVTFTIGGDNYDSFANIVKWCVYGHIFEQCNDALLNATKVLDTLDDAVTTMYKAVQSRAPAAKIIHFGYVEFWPFDDVPKNCHNEFLRLPTAFQKLAMNTLVGRVNDKLAKVASKNNVIFVDVNPRFEGHRLCDTGEAYLRYQLYDRHATEWNYHNGIFHPTWEGQNLYFDALRKTLGCSTTQSEKVMDEL